MSKHLQIRALYNLLFSSCLMAFALVLLPAKSQASRKVIAGYIISQQDDTVSTLLAIHVDAFGRINQAKLNHTIELPDSCGNFLNLNPEDINGFGFAFKGKQYVFLTKPIDQQGHLMFVQPMLSGPNLTLYCYKQLFHQHCENHYTFERQDGTYICISSASTPKQIQSDLKSFFHEDEVALQYLATCFASRARIQKDVDLVAREVNKEKPSLATRRK